jgi:putative toxin-antitoxin system antitoxin component (TIGR02293 family)
MSGFSEAPATFVFPHETAGHVGLRVTDLLDLDLGAPSALEIHDICAAGLPGAALEHLVGSVGILQNPAVFETALGMSIRTYQRRREESEKPLSPEQSGRVWQFAEILVQAVAVFGAQADAEDWLLQPAMGLNRRRPIDLLASPSGVALLEDFLGRLEYGVYT